MIFSFLRIIIVVFIYNNYTNFFIFSEVFPNFITLFPNFSSKKVLFFLVFFISSFAQFTFDRLIDSGNLFRRTRTCFLSDKLRRSSFLLIYFLIFC